VLLKSLVLGSDVLGSTGLLQWVLSGTVVFGFYVLRCS